MKWLVFVISVCAGLLKPAGAFALSVSAEYACVIEMNSGEVVYDKNAHLRHSMASTTKIMTALLAIENGCLDDIVTASRNASIQEGSSIYLRAGDTIVMRDLLYGLMLNSGNDAAVAVAEHVAGSVEEFAKLMTQKAHEIGAEDTQFKNPNGLDADGHYTTAYDLALISRRAMQNSEFAEIVGTKSKKVTLKNNNADIYLSNHNKMLKIYDGATGVKTGYTRATGRCLVSSAQRNGMSFIAVTLNAPDDWTDHTNMLNYAFETYEKKDVIKEGDVLKRIPLADGRDIEVCAGGDVGVVMKKSGGAECEVVLHVSDKIAVPLNAMEKIGEAEVKYNGVVVGSVDLINKSELKIIEENKGKAGLFEQVISIFGEWLAAA